ncbi:MAG: GldG family protein [Verrucomicrobiota bacterium]
MSQSTSSGFKLGRSATAVLGLLVVLAILFAINFLVGLFGQRIDLTENKVYTLSDGTKSILADLDTPVTIRYYATDDADVMGPSERARAQRVEDLLNEYVRSAPKKEVELPNEDGEFEKQNIRMLTVQKLNPIPNTDAEDSAMLDGIQPVTGETNSEILFGLAVECLDANEVIPFIGADSETALEYNLSRAISLVHDGKDKNLVVMTSMSVGGGFSGNFQAPPQQPWFFYEQLGRDYNISTIPATATEIPAGTDTLIVLHPYDIDDGGQFAIDQYLLQGGNVIAMVDPNFFYSRALAQGQQPQMPGMPPQGGPPPTSDLPKLFPAYGIQYNAEQVVADLSFATEIMQRGNFSPTFLTLTQDAYEYIEGAPALEDPMTRTVNDLNLLTPGGLDIAPPAGIEVTRLIGSSPVNQLISSFDADPTAEGGADRIRESFVPHGESRTFVVRLTGNFKTAFPDGDPNAPAPEEAEASDGPTDEEADAALDADDPEAAAAASAADIEVEAEPYVDTSLKVGTSPGTLLVISDVDFIYDANVVRRQQIPGLNIVFAEPLNENLDLFQNAVELLSGDPELVHVRSRDSVRRRFTRQSEWYAEAQEKYSAELEEFSEKARQAESRLSDILSQTPDIDQALVSPEVQNEIENLRQEQVAFSKRARDLEKEVAREFRRKLGIFKFGNSLIMPAIIIIFGLGLWVFRRVRTAAR